jgi:hypothetical protein
MHNTLTTKQTAFRRHTSKAALCLSLSAIACLSAVNALAQSTAPPTSNPNYGVTGPMSGTAPSSGPPLSGFEQKGVSGIRPGQPGNPMATPQSGGKDGKSGVSASNQNSAKQSPGQNGKGKGPGTQPVNGVGNVSGKNGAPDAASLGCINCATILQVRTVRMKHTPSWMLNTDARAPETANSQNTDLPNRGQGSSIGTTGNRSIINPDGAGAQFGKRMYEVTLMMDSGLTRKIHLDMMPGFNLGSKVRVMGNRLSPR